MSKTTISFETLPKGYADLVKQHAPRPIRDESTYESTLELIDTLAVAEEHLNADQADYLEVLTTLLEDYEDRTVAKPKPAPPAEMVRFLLKENGMTGEDLAQLLSIDRSQAYKLLKGSRKLTMDHVRKLCERFKVTADLFIQSRLRKPGARRRTRPTQQA